MAEFLIEHPPGYPAERSYAFEVALGRHFGFSFQIRESNRRDVKITLLGQQNQRSVRVSDVLFQTPPDEWLTPCSLPQEPLDSFVIPREFSYSASRVLTIPIVYGSPASGERYLTTSSDGVYVGIDVFGTLFFMLSRYEELLDATRDKHGRFPATRSIAFRGGFLKRPIVNEYLELLWIALKKTWPSINRSSRRSARILLSHDVDWPTSTTNISRLRMLRSCAGDVLQRRDLIAATRRLSAYTVRGDLGWRMDPMNTFGFIMDQSESADTKSDFYFIPGAGRGDINGNCDLESNEIRRLMRSIKRRGHGIGYHGSYDSKFTSGQIRREFGLLRRVMQEEGLSQGTWCGRQHYLRWEAPDTWQKWTDAGLDCDSSVGFAEETGFRCGFCNEFPVFNLRSRERLELIERPLIAMDQTLSYYMKLSWPTAFAHLLELHATCCKYGGDFTLLWHNSSLVSRTSRRRYQELVEVLSSRHRTNLAA